MTEAIGGLARLCLSLIVVMRVMSSGGSAAGPGWRRAGLFQNQTPSTEALSASLTGSIP